MLINDRFMYREFKIDFSPKPTPNALATGTMYLNSDCLLALNVYLDSYNFGQKFYVSLEIFIFTVLMLCRLALCIYLNRHSSKEDFLPYYQNEIDYMTISVN